MNAAIARSNMSSMAMYDTVDLRPGLEAHTVDSSVGGGSPMTRENRGNPTFKKVAHVHGLCSLDELIQACRARLRGDGGRP